MLGGQPGPGAEASRADEVASTPGADFALVDHSFLVAKDISIDATWGRKPHRRCSGRKIARDK